MNEQPIDIRTSLMLVRHRRRLLALCAGVGAVVGLGYGLLKAPLPSASALVGLPSAPANSPNAAASDPQTQAAIVGTQSVLEPAGSSVSPAVPWTTLLHRVKASGVAGSIVSISVRASNAAEAEKLANAVAQAYVSYAAAQNQSSETAQITAQQTSADNLKAQISTEQQAVNSAVATLANGGGNAGATLNALQAQLSGTLSAFTTIETQIANEELTVVAAPTTPRLLQHATTASQPSLTRLPLFGLLGAVVGFVVGLVPVLRRGRRALPLRRRQDMATALGSQVVASIESGGPRREGDWQVVLEMYKPSVVDAWSMSRLLKRIQERTPAAVQHVRFVSFAGDAAALAAGPQFALFAAGKGVSTEMVTCPHPAAAALRAACAVAHSRDDLDWSNQEAEDGAAPLTISVDVVDGAEPTLVPRYQGTTFLAVSPGSATAEDFARLALAALESGETIDGIIVVNADSKDTSSGEDAGNQDLSDKVARLPSGHLRKQLGGNQAMDSAPEQGYL